MEEVLSLDYLRRHLDEQKTVIHYIYAKPTVLDILESSSHLGAHITISRLYECIVEKNWAKNILQSVAHQHAPLSLSSKGQEFYGPNKDIPVLTYKAPDLIAFHEDLQYRFALAGSFDLSEYMGASFSPHTTLDKKLESIPDVLQQPFNITEVFYTQKIFGVWSDEISSFSLET